MVKVGYIYGGGMGVLKERSVPVLDEQHLLGSQAPADGVNSFMESDRERVTLRVHLVPGITSGKDTQGNDDMP